VSDSEEFTACEEAMAALQFSAVEKGNILRVAAAVLNLGT